MEAFSQGRRICPGKKLAENSLFISVTRILWGFDISKAIDPSTGLAVEYNTFAYTDGFNSKPQPFQCCIKPRSAEIREAIEYDAVLGEKFLNRYV
jgi:hypothetical protein